MKNSPLEFGMKLRPDRSALCHLTLATATISCPRVDAKPRLRVSAHSRPRAVTCRSRGCPAQVPLQGKASAAACFCLFRPTLSVTPRESREQAFSGESPGITSENAVGQSAQRADWTPENAKPLARYAGHLGTGRPSSKDARVRVPRPKWRSSGGTVIRSLASTPSRRSTGVSRSASSRILKDCGKRRSIRRAAVNA